MPCGTGSTPSRITCAFVPTKPKALTAASRGASAALLASLRTEIQRGLEPDLTLLLDAPLETLHRLLGRLADKLEDGRAQMLEINPRFGAAWSRAPGLYGADYAGDYQLREKLGAGARIWMDEVFDLPSATRTAVPKFDLRSPYADQRVRSLQLTGGAKTSVTLQPFEVLVFDTDSAR